MPWSEKELADRLVEAGVEFEILIAPHDTPTAQSAADVFMVPVETIVKSLLFAERNAGRFVLVVAGGATRVDTSKLGVGNWSLAKPSDVERVTGYAVGTVPPVAHATPVRVLVDERVLAHDTVIGGGGAPRTSLRIATADVVRLTGAYVRDVAG